MAPVTDQVADELKALVRKLEDRVHELETRLGGGSPSSSGSTANASQSMRMIIMGPPGAGEQRTGSAFLS